MLHRRICILVLSSLLVSSLHCPVSCTCFLAKPRKNASVLVVEDATAVTDPLTNPRQRSLGGCDPSFRNLVPHGTTCTCPIKPLANQCVLSRKGVHMVLICQLPGSIRGPGKFGSKFLEGRKPFRCSKPMAPGALALKAGAPLYLLKDYQAEAISE